MIAVIGPHIQTNATTVRKMAFRETDRRGNSMFMGDRKPMLRPSRNYLRAGTLLTGLELPKDLEEMSGPPTPTVEGGNLT